MAEDPRSSPILGQLGQGPNNWYQSSYDPVPEVGGWQSYNGHGGSGSWQGSPSEPSPSPPQPFESNLGGSGGRCSIGHGFWRGLPPEPPPEPLDPILEGSQELRPSNRSSRRGSSEDCRSATKEERMMILEAFMPKIKEGRTVQIDSLCDFGNVGEPQLEPEQDVRANDQMNHPTSEVENIRQGHTSAVEAKEGQQQEINSGKGSFEFLPCGTSRPLQEEKSSSMASKETPSFVFPILPVTNVAVAPAGEDVSATTPSISVKDSVPMRLKNQRASEACTPKAQKIPVKGETAPTNSRKQTAKKNDSSSIRQPSAFKMKDQSPYVQSSKSTKLKSVIKPAGNTAKKNTVAHDFVQENQAIKRQKLDNGRTRQILNVKNRVLPRKSKPGSDGGTDTFSSSVRRYREDSIVRKECTASIIHRRPKLTLTRPKEPAFETAQRVRAVRVKSSAELEEEMLAKIPKFKARPVNKKILEAPSLPPLTRSALEPPEFQEFHLKTMERANQHAETSSVVSYTSSQNQSKPLRLTEPKPPLLETSLRARPIKVKSSQELEAEELEKIPKFKARPLNKKIFESKGDLGLFCNPKPQITTPQEFHFATNERLGPHPLVVTELFDKLSLHSETSYHRDQHDIPGLTIPNPFHLHTEERGLLKERQFSVQIIEKQLEEVKARVPKANPYPYTTDYPVIPPKPQPKQCTKPEAFQLESLVRHEEEMQRKLEEKERLEKEEAQKRMFKAQPILREDPIPLPEKERKPLTDVQEFVLHVDHRVAERSEFDKKIREKQVIYKRLRDEQEFTKMIEEEKAVKQMRRTMVPHAKPLPKFHHPFQPQKSTKERTKPKSPLLHVKLREEERRRGHVHLR